MDSLIVVVGQRRTNLVPPSSGAWKAFRERAENYPSKEAKTRKLAWPVWCFKNICFRNISRAYVNFFIYLHGNFARSLRRIPCFARRSGGSGTRVVLLLSAATGAFFARVSFLFRAGSDDAMSGGCGATVVATAGSVFLRDDRLRPGRFARFLPGQRKPSRGARRLELLSYPRFRRQLHSLGRLLNWRPKSALFFQCSSFLASSPGRIMLNSQATR
jgi:hypothetical protein